MRVFISYAVEDKALAEQLAGLLRASGFEVWDESQVLPGDNWAEKMAEALRQSAALVVLLTPHALQAKHVSHEIGYALGERKFKGRVVPVLAASSEQLPKEQIPWILNKFGVIDLVDLGPKEAFQKVAQVLQKTA